MKVNLKTIKRLVWAFLFIETTLLACAQTPLSLQNVQSKSCAVASTCHDSMQANYQRQRNAIFSQGAMMLHEEFSNFHYGFKYKVNDRIYYQSAIWINNTMTIIESEGKETDDKAWRNIVRQTALKQGATNEDLVNDGLHEW